MTNTIAPNTTSRLAALVQLLNDPAITLTPANTEAILDSFATANNLGLDTTDCETQNLTFKFWPHWTSVTGETITYRFDGANIVSVN